jgi:hypothetical protein
MPIGAAAGRQEPGKLPPIAFGYHSMQKTEPVRATNEPHTLGMATTTRSPPISQSKDTKGLDLAA